MKTKEEIKNKIIELESLVETLLDQQRASNFTTFVITTQEINSTKHSIQQLNWVLEEV